MKKLIITILCFCGIASFAQNGFFLQPEIGGGISNTCWQPFTFKGLPGQQSILSYQGQVDAGYNAGKWRFSTGVGYLLTGVHLQPGSIANFNNYVVIPFAETNNLFIPYSEKITDYNPHIIIPLKVAYEVKQFNDRLSFVPQIGAEFAMNQRRTFVFSNSVKQEESASDFKSACNPHSIMGMVQLNFEYRLNSHYAITAGPSAHYMFTSELNFKDQQDYAVLMNLGLKWNFRKHTDIHTR